MFKFVHAADVHLDSPLRGLGQYEGAPVERVRGATRKALEAVVDLAIDEAAAFLLLSGDVFDGDWRDYKTGLYFIDQMARLGRAGIRAYMIRGNHDAANRAMKRLALPSAVHEFASTKPETERLEDLGVVIHGQSFQGGAVTTDLAAGYPEAVLGMLNIGMLHTSLNGRPGHEAYAPCTTDELVAKGYDYWALGHVHEREIVRQEPWIVFPGNVQGRHVREQGAKGCTVVTVEDGRVASVEHRPVCVLRWAVCDVDASGAATPEEIVGRVREGVEAEIANQSAGMVAIRLRVTGACPAHAGLSADPDHWRAEVRAMATEAGRGDAWVEKIELQTRIPVDLAAAEERDDALGDLLRSIKAVAGDNERLLGLLPELGDLRAKVPPELATGADPVRLDDPAYLRDALAQARDVLATRLLEGGQDA